MENTVTKKAGCVLINIEKQKVILVFRDKDGECTFPKGHLEYGESLVECAVRETEEETGRKNHLVEEKELDIVRYITSKGENVELHLYLAIDEGKTEKEIPEELKEEPVEINIDDVEDKIQFQNLKEFWRKSKHRVKKLIEEYNKNGRKI